MKALIKTSLKFAVSISILALVIPLSHIHAQGPNLILNPDIETGDTTPSNWNVGSWGGTVVTSTYSTTDGSTGKALGLAITTAGTGDAKWYNDAVAVTAGSTYTFTDSYKTTVNSDVILQYTLNDATYSYDLIGSLTPSATWTTFTKEFVVPANATNVSVFHLINQVGEIWTDNYSLSLNDTVIIVPPVDPTPIDTTNHILNPSFETAATDTTKPANWNQGGWGTNTPVFEYATTGNTGTRSGHVTMSAYTDGDAKWYSDDFAVTAGSTYTFADKYKATIDTLIYIQFNVGGTFQYGFLGTAPATLDWSTAQHNFTVPAGATSASVFHVIAGVGELWTDDYSVTAATTIVPPINTDGNLIINPSAETANANQPVTWNQGKWGSNTAIFDYSSDAQDGTKSLHLTVNNYVDGDAKWYNDAVNVSGDSQYTLSHYYKSTAASQTILQYVSTTGVYSYVILGTNAAASTWTKVDYTFIVPDGAKSVSVFHVLAANGELWTDNYKLVSVPVTGDTSHVPNGSVEEVNPTNANQPNKWSSSSWGTNDATFEYLTTGGYNSNHAVKTTITNYTDGDAKWLNDAIQLTAGVNYKFTDYYKSNVDTRIVLDITMENGTTQYLELPGAPASADWTQYAGTFTMPAGASTVSIYHMLTVVGFLITDKYDVNEYNPTPFNNALITLTFDDGWEDNVTTTLPLLAQYGYLTDQFYATTFIQNAEMGEAAAIETINQFAAAGHEINSHTITHPDLTTLTTEQSLKELTDSKAYLQSKFNITNYFATPYGAYNTAVKAQIMANYSVHRTVDVGFNSKDSFDVSRLKVQNILSTTTAAEVAAWIAQAQTEKTWLILVFHRVATDPGDYDTTPTKFAEMLSAINTSGISVKTITQALAELQPQL